jgi:predicted nucleotidyltransferase
MKEVTKAIHKQPYLSYIEQQVVEDIVQKIPSVYSLINKIILYGSRARGDFLEDSDIDILFVTDYSIPRVLKFEIYDMLYEFEVEYGVIISVIFVSKEVFETRTTSFIRQVQREGVILWSRG